MSGIEIRKLISGDTVDSRKIATFRISLQTHYVKYVMKRKDIIRYHDRVGLSENQKNSKAAQ